MCGAVGATSKVAGIALQLYSFAGQSTTQILRKYLPGKQHELPPSLNPVEPYRQAAIVELLSGAKYQNIHDREAAEGYEVVVVNVIDKKNS